MMIRWLFLVGLASVLIGIGGCEAFVNPDGYVAKARLEEAAKNQVAYREAALSYKLVEERDDFKKFSAKTMTQGFKELCYHVTNDPGDEGECWAPNPEFTFRVSQILEKQRAPYYWFIFTYQGDGWMFIPEGGSAIFIIDGKNITLNGEGSAEQRDTLGGEKVREVAYYKVQRSFLMRLAKAKSVKLKVVGKKMEPTFEFEQEHLENVTLFLRDTK